MLKVTKFGGSSMASAKQYRKVKDIITSDPSRKIVVVSAAGKDNNNIHKITDLLYLCDAHIKYGVDCSSIFNMFTNRYLEIRDELDINLNLEEDFSSLRQQMENQNITRDELVSRGEYYSAKLMAAYLGYEFVDATELIFFNMDGSVNFDKTYKTVKEKITNRRVVVPGFYGLMPTGHIKTFARGGSDITGSLLAAALDVDVYENWTDVSGILMADPRIVGESETIEEVTYDELEELSYTGAQVLNEESIYPVREKGIPLNIRNTNDPTHPGSMIKESFDEPVERKYFITGVTGKKDFTILSISKKGMINQIGILKNILAVLEGYRVKIDYYIPNGVDNISVIMPTNEIEKNLHQILSEIEVEIEPDHIETFDKIAMVAAVGRQMPFRPGISGQIFGALGKAGINIRLINQGPDEINVTFGVDNKDFNKAIQVIYSCFI